jgi:hypothetical protein
MEPLFELAMSCPECGCQFCPNCFGAVCDCATVFYRHDVSHCDPSADERCQMCGSVYPAGQLHHCMPGEPGDPRDEEFIGGYRPGLDDV